MRACPPRRECGSHESPHQQRQSDRSQLRQRLQIEVVGVAEGEALSPRSQPALPKPTGTDADHGPRPRGVPCNTPRFAASLPLHCQQPPLPLDRGGRGAEAAPGALQHTSPPPPPPNAAHPPPPPNTSPP